MAKSKIEFRTDVMEKTSNIFICVKSDTQIIHMTLCYRTKKISER